MAKSSKIRIMISSRCNDTFPETSRKLSQIREELKTEIESFSIAGKQAFDVWINEHTPPQGGTWDSWDTCMQAVKDCDIFLAISNGNAGWTEGGIGICHAELMTALSSAPAKVRLFSIGNIAVNETPSGKRNKDFQDYVRKQSLFSPEIKSIDQLKDRIKDALFDAVLRLTQAGVQQASKGKFHAGDALDWSRLSFDDRQAEMLTVLKKELMDRPQTIEAEDQIFIYLDNTKILICPHAIPAALTIGAAKERVGQPFLKDYLLAQHLDRKSGGPVHIIACHKSITESQATKLLGFPDATFVTAPFGVFVADPIQKVQLAFIANCRDSSSTKHGLQRFFAWIEQTNEEALISQRGLARARICKAISDENSEEVVDFKPLQKAIKHKRK